MIHELDPDVIMDSHLLQCPGPNPVVVYCRYKGIATSEHSDFLLSHIKNDMELGIGALDSPEPAGNSSSRGTFDPRFSNQLFFFEYIDHNQHKDMYGSDHFMSSRKGSTRCETHDIAQVTNQKEAMQGGPEIIGEVFECCCGTSLIPRRIPVYHVNELIYFGKNLNASTAFVLARDLLRLPLYLSPVSGLLRVGGLTIYALTTTRTR
ncbi:hypothetical protein EV359DRAFT_59500 [Lentinula novae-zelandiae]|nr:hypothetical protein EV359DRAFT_59500 [Lentinula novae-zelandiae]